jgi:predicted DNA-binding protein (MmcQ/YjbR family)
MDIEAFRAYCIKKKGVTEDFPFDEETIVFKVMGKMFALADVDLFESVNLKCLPERSIELREHFNGITPGYHMNKKHWNTIRMDGSVPNELILNLIDHSYQLVVQNLPKSVKADLEKIN